MQKNKLEWLKWDFYKLDKGNFNIFAALALYVVKCYCNATLQKCTVPGKIRFLGQ